MSLLSSITPKYKNTNIFKVPEAPQEIVHEKKVPVAVPPKTEVPPTKGICPQ